MFVLGKDRYGRVRGLGTGISLNKLDILNAKDSHVQKLLATQAEMATKIEDLQSQLHCLAGKKQSGADLDAQSNVSNTNKGGSKCKILDWYSKDEVIILHSATIPNASIWRPTATVSKVSQAVGVEIPWPDDKVVLESDNNSPTEHNMASDEQPIYNIFAWNGTDIVVEGIICSVYKNEKVNQIPLGPNAAIIKVLKVIDHGACLWRPTAELALMGDVLNECIQWPLDKIYVVVNTSPEVSPKKSTETTSKSTGTSKSSKQKCILLDCNGSGRVVAEGRVCSTDPVERVHFVPLGPNASKVWIDVSKIGDADVWRPNSEVVCVDNAKGTTIAWPNDKLKLV